MTVVSVFKRFLRFLRKRWWIVLIALLVLGFLFMRANTPKGPQYTYEHPELRTIEETTEVSGRVDATKKATLKFLGGGKLTYLPVHEGQRVNRYQAIASIDTRDLKKNLQKDLNDYMSSRLTLEESKKDAADGAFTDTVKRLAQKSQLSLNNSVLDVELQDLAIKNSSLYAPIAGVVTKVPLDVEGVQVLSTDAFEIVDPASLVFEGEVDEVDIGQITEGLPVRIVLDAYPDNPVDGTVDKIALTARASTSSSGGTVFPITVSLKDADIFKYRLGLNGTMNIIRSKAENVLSVPISALTEKNDKTYVLVKKDDGTVEEREVTTGAEGEDYIEIRSGLSTDDEIALSN